MTLILSGTNGLSDVDGDASTPAVRGTDANSGIFFGADQVGVATNGVERVEFGNSETVFNDGGANLDFRVEGDTDANLLFVDASADAVGIGTGSPSYKLQAVKDGAGAANNTITNSAFVVSRTTGASENIGFRLQDGSNGISGTNFVGQIIGSGVNGLEIYNAGNVPLVFGTNATERMRIDSSGNLLVGTTSNYGGRKLDVRGTNGSYLISVTNSNASPSGMQVIYSASSPNGTGNSFYYAEDSTATRFVVRSNGGIANYSANNVNLSDRREKTNFAPSGNYLSKICAIPVQTFNYIDQSEDDPGLTLGVVAQDVQEVAPELVMESNWGTEDNPKMRLSVYQTDLQYALMKCIQELKAENDALKSRLDAAGL